MTDYAQLPTKIPSGALLAKKNLAEESRVEENTATQHPRPSIVIGADFYPVVFGKHYDSQILVRDAVSRLVDKIESSQTYSQEARSSYDSLRQVVRELGGSSRAIAADQIKLAALFDWAAITAPKLLPILSGHFNLTIGGVERLGDGSKEQQKYLEQLDRVEDVGVLLLTELGYGSNVLELKTQAIWNAETRRFTLNTPTGEACKFMPNVGDPSVAKTITVAARLIAEGIDQGIFLFVFPFRTDKELRKGINVVPLPDKGYVPMDNAMIRFDNLELPKEAWLSAGIATISDEDGSFSCEVNFHERFHRSVGQLQSGRISLAGATVASARAGLALAVNYAEQRRTASGIEMIKRDNVQRDFVSSMAHIYAMTTLANEVHGRFADPTSQPRETAMMAMLAKPILSSTALKVLQLSRERCGSQGMFRVNRITDYIGGTQGTITAEGDNQVLQVAAGRALSRMNSSDLKITNSLDIPQWWNTMLVTRELGLAERGRSGGAEGAAAIGPNSFAIELAQATAERLAAESLVAAAAAIADPQAQQIVQDLAAIYALESVRTHALWYSANGQLTPELAVQIEIELAQRHQAVVPHLSVLAAGFALPELNAPMTGDYVANWLRFAGWEEMPRESRV